MTKLDKEILQNAKDFSAMHMKDARAEFLATRNILVAHLVSLYLETSEKRISYYLREINALLSTVKGINLKTRGNFGVTRIFGMLWKDVFDDSVDGKLCEDNLVRLIKDREDHESVKIDYEGKLKDIALFCRTFIYRLSELLSKDSTRNFTKEDLRGLYESSLVSKENLKEKLKLYW